MFFTLSYIAVQSSFFGFLKLYFDLNRPKKSKENEKDKLSSGVEPRSNDQQTNTLDTEPQSPDKSMPPQFPPITAVVVA